MKPTSPGPVLPLFLRIAGALCIVILFMILCLFGTVAIAYIAGIVFNSCFS
jgi:hypothetical protein